MRKGLKEEKDEKKKIDFAIDSADNNRWFDGGLRFFRSGRGCGKYGKYSRQCGR